MSRKVRRILTVVVAAALVLAADPAFARVHRRGRRGGGFGGTAASAAMFGYAQLLRAQGQANLQNSQAAINWEQAKTLEIQNRAAWTQTYFQMRSVNHAMQLAEHGPRITEAEAAKLAHDALPPRLGPGELDPQTGAIVYPPVLTDPRYADLRPDIDGFFRRRAAAHGSIDFVDLQHVETILDLWHAALREDIGSYSGGDYGRAVTFLDQLGLEARLPPR